MSRQSCKFCDATYALPENLRRHVREKHPTVPLAPAKQMDWECQPRIIRIVDGYLACTPEDMPYRFAARGRTEAEASEAFVHLCAAWRELSERGSGSTSA